MSCDWLWHSHGSLIRSRFDLKNKSVYENAVTGIWLSCMLPLIGSCLLLFCSCLSSDMLEHSQTLALTRFMSLVAVNTGENGA